MCKSIVLLSGGEDPAEGGGTCITSNGKLQKTIDVPVGFIFAQSTIP